MCLYKIIIITMIIMKDETNRRLVFEVGRLTRRDVSTRPGNGWVKMRQLELLDSAN